MSSRTAFIASFLILAACDSPVEFESQAQMVQSSNGLSANGLSLNGLSLNGLSLNGLSLNGLSLNGLSLNGLSLNGLSLNGLQQDNLRTVFHYIVGCALESGDTIVIDGETFEGALGLAPEWANGVLDLSGQESISSCLLAHSNSAGAHIAISLNSHNLTATSYEKRSYIRNDGAFWGNLFAPEATAFACYAGNDPVGTGRDCSLPAENGLTHCGFQAAGLCNDVCSFKKKRFFSNCSSGGARPITVWTFEAICDEFGCEG